MKPADWSLEAARKRLAARTDAAPGMKLESAMERPESNAEVCRAPSRREFAVTLLCSALGIVALFLATHP